MGRIREQHIVRDILRTGVLRVNEGCGEPGRPAIRAAPS